jgi:hypothetical protein
MEKLPKDVLVLLAIDLDYADILRLCKSSSRMNRFVCQNENFWRNKLYKIYPFARKLQEKYPISNFKKFYRDVEMQLQSTNAIQDGVNNEMIDFGTPYFIRPELVNFFMYTDFGLIPGTEVPINYILWPLLKEGIMSRNTATVLSALHAKKYSFTENGKKFFKSSPDMILYLEKYLNDLERKGREEGNIFNAQGILKLPFSKDKFLFNRYQSILSEGFISKNNLTEVQLNQLKDMNTLTKNIYKKISDIKGIVYNEQAYN